MWVTVAGLSYSLPFRGIHGCRHHRTGLSLVGDTGTASRIVARHVTSRGMGGAVASLRCIKFALGRCPTPREAWTGNAMAYEWCRNGATGQTTQHSTLAAR